MKDEKRIEQWLNFSDNDSFVAQNIFSTFYPKPYEIICFHCQQAIEKRLKALGIANDIEPEKTHDLAFLLNKYENKTGKSISTEIKLSCARLSDYSVKTRYPNDFQLDYNKVSLALLDMKKIENWIDSELEKLNIKHKSISPALKTQSKDEIADQISDLLKQNSNDTKKPNVNHKPNDDWDMN